VQAFGRDRDRRERFAKELSARLGIPVVPASSAEEAVRGSDIVITSTNSVQPVLEGRWLEPGMHVSAIGVNFAHRRELDIPRRWIVQMLIAADSVEQSKIESGDLIQAFGSNAAGGTMCANLRTSLPEKFRAAQAASKSPYFKSNGIAIEDIVVAGRLYEIARERGIGREIRSGRMRRLPRRAPI